MLPVSIFTIKLRTPIMKIEVKRFFSHPGNFFFMKGTLFIRFFISFTMNHNNRANTKGISRLCPTINIKTIAIIIVGLSIVIPISILI